jgi:hypothetical protein
MTKRITRAKALRKRSAVADARQSGLELVRKEKVAKKDLATPEGIADIDFKPWKRDKSLAKGELWPGDKEMINCAVAARMSYAVMLMDKPALVAMHGKIEHKHVDAMMGQMMDSAEMLKAVASMIEQAYLRILAAASFKALRTRQKFKGVGRVRRADV